VIGASDCMELALKDAGISPSEVDHINTHGTSTPQGDIGESQAVERVFGDHTPNVLCTSTKSMTGHTLGAAGALEAIITILAIENNICPPTINLENQDEDIKINICAHKAQEKEINVALTNSFGFGGTNASIVLRKAP